jgi:hypothetical protein
MIATAAIAQASCHMPFRQQFHGENSRSVLDLFLPLH